LAKKKAKSAAQKPKKQAAKKVAKSAAKAVRPAKAAKVAAKPAPAPAPVKAEAKKAEGKKPEGKAAKGQAGKGPAGKVDSAAQIQRNLDVFIPPPGRPGPRASKLSAAAEALTKREMEQVLTVAAGRGVQGEGSLKGMMIVHRGFPYLEVIGRDKRELYFLLEGPDQEVLPAYLDHKVSVSGLVRKQHNYGGTVEVRKYSAKKLEVEAPPVPEPVVAKLRFLSPGEVAQVSSPGMGAGMKGFATIRGTLELAGEDFFLVITNGGTRQQVSFTLEGKGAKGIKRYLGHMLQVSGVIEKVSGWGGTLQVETAEPRPGELHPVSRDAIDVTEVESPSNGSGTTVKVNHGLSVRLPERVGFTWAIEPMTAKRVSLREANFENKGSAAGTREFFFTPRIPGTHEVEFFLAKAFNPLQVQKSVKLTVNVLPGEVIA
jgi:hypothetical protein